MSGNKRLFFSSALVLLFFLGVYLFLVWPAQKRFKRSCFEVRNKMVTLRAFFTRPEGPPANKEDNFLSSEIKILEETSKDIEKNFLPKKEALVMATPVEFGNILYRTKKELLEESKKAGVKIPADLGFKETIPAEDEVKIMTRELEAITFIIKEDLTLRAVDIETIKYLGLGRDGPWEKVSLELSLSGEFGKLMEFLYHLSQGDKIYVLRFLELKKGKEAAVVTAPRLKAGPALPLLEAQKEGKKEEKEELKGGEERIFAIVSLDSYTYEVSHEN